MSIEEHAEIGCFSEVSEGVYYSTKDNKRQADTGMIGQLKLEALNTEKKRARLCFHDSETAIVHTMVIALAKDSLIKRHFHPKSNETYVIIDGKLQISLYEESGRRDVFLHEGGSIVFQVPAGVEHGVCSVT